MRSTIGHSRCSPAAVFLGCFAALALACIASTGCKNEQVGPPVNDEGNLKRISIFYGQYAGQHGGRGPAKLEEFKAFVKQQASAPNATVTVTDADKLFVSSRDNQPYVVIMNANVNQPKAPIAYEAQGTGGTRLVVYSLGQVEELDAAAFQAAVPGAK